MTHFADGLRVGSGFYGRSIGNGTNPAGREEKGVQVHSDAQVSVVTLLGAPNTADVDAIVDSVYVTTTAGGSLTLSGALVSTGVATFDVPRNVTITSTGSNAAVTFTITGTDKYGAAMTEAIIGPTTVVGGTKAFLTVSAVATDLATTTAGTAIEIGTGDVLGLPYHLADLGKIASITENGLSVTGGSLLVGVTAAATATTGDIRGTFDPQTAMNGSVYVTLTMVVDASAKDQLYGVDQA